LPATLGIAAEEAGKYGASSTDEAKAMARSTAGDCVTNAIANQHDAEADSLMIITRRRSNRSPNAPASGPRKPITAHVSSIVAEIHAVDCVSR
jgi:hypothetical protein